MIQQQVCVYSSESCNKTVIEFSKIYYITLYYNFYVKEEFIRIQGFICSFAEEYLLNKIVRYYSESPTVK